MTSVARAVHYYCGKVFEPGMTQGLRAVSCADKNRYYCLHNYAILTEMEVSPHNIVQLSWRCWWARCEN